MDYGKQLEWIQSYDILFISETHSKLPDIKNFIIAGHYTSSHSKRGGIAIYVKKDLASHVHNVITNECYISLQLRYAPTITFIGVYIPPIDSVYFNEDCFADVISFLIDNINRGHTLFVGGDFNSRPGDLNNINPRNGMRYEKNVDVSTNSHGTIFGDLCRTTNLLPINHLRYNDQIFPGQFTFYRGNKKSQIDYVLTNMKGLELIDTMQFVNKDWHISDHIPIALNLQLPVAIDLRAIYMRICDLNNETMTNREKLKTSKHCEFNIEHFTEYLHESRTSLEEICQADENLEVITTNLVGQLQETVHDAIQRSRIKKDKSNITIVNMMATDANNKFETYTNAIKENESEERINQLWDDYQQSSRQITPSIIELQHSEWHNKIKSKSDKELWNSIDWNGKMEHQRPPDPPPLNELCAHFENLYTSPDDESPNDIDQLASNVYIPELDDAITLEEIQVAGNHMKKGGFDFPNNVVKPMMDTFGDILVFLMNLLFSVAHPAYLGLSLLCALPKKGNLRLPKNYRGIQMTPLLGGWYDRILALRISRWIGINYEQTAFQKGKSTAHQIFTLRLIMALCKKYKRTLFIAFFDIEKAFDRVSRYLLLKKLIELGIGHIMFEAIKRMYSCTHCILKFMGNISDQFETCTGIRQGAHSSVLLFIIFMDGAINYLKTKCDPEPILENLHCLLHADDTVILSVDFEKFIKKCNCLIDYYSENKLRLNLNKSAYMVVNGPRNYNKMPLQLDAGQIEYQPIYVYLGSPISDSGSMPHDLKEHIKLRRPNVLVKLSRFLKNNIMCPVAVKLKVLQSCVNSSLLYGCESWAGTNLANLEALNRKTTKMVLGVRPNTPNDIVTVELNRVPLEAHVQQQQKKFWINLKHDISLHPDSPLARLINSALRSNIPYVRHYEKLLEMPYTKAKDFGLETLESAKFNIRTKGTEDPLSAYGQYLLVNPDLVGYDDLYKIPTMPEPDRILLTRYRCGSHKLRIETGRWDRTPRADRHCNCMREPQTLDHILYRCPITDSISNPTGPLNEFIKTCDCARTLRRIEHLI